MHCYQCPHDCVCACLTVVCSGKARQTDTHWIKRIIRLWRSCQMPIEYNQNTFPLPSPSNWCCLISIPLRLRQTLRRSLIPLMLSDELHALTFISPASKNIKVCNSLKCRRWSFMHFVLSDVGEGWVGRGLFITGSPPHWMLSNCRECISSSPGSVSNHTTAASGCTGLWGAS